MDDHSYRLPRTVIPRRYDLRLEPDLKKATFTGSVSIAVEVQEPVKTVVLNSAQLAVSEAVLEAGGKTLPGSPELAADEERLTLRFEQPIPAGSAKLTIRFAGVLNDQLVGFYRSHFTDTDGQRHVIAVSQFEATDARKAFPCWDEPDLKAVFAVTMVVDDDLFVVSNAAEVSRRPLDGKKVEVRFADTMVMSTYVVAFLVGPFEATTPVDVDGVPLRIIAPKGKSHLTEFSLDVGSFALRWFEEYYGIPYPGDKCDFVAVPDFAFGAMENLGCIVFRESALLIDPEVATQVELARVADVIAHELAHMWFGDLVTMKWWNGVWLNEAFASFMEMKCADDYRPEWQRWLAFAAEPGAEKSDSMDVDALAATRPVEFEVRSPAEATEMFDALTYGKGSAVLRMLEQYLGEGVFRDGIRLYLKRHSYSNTETADLWLALEEVAGQPVAEIMNTFILQGGYPQVTVSEVANGIRLTQARFTLLPTIDPSTWQVPLVIREGSRRRQLLLDSTSHEVAAGPEAIINGGGSGFYRVAYPTHRLELLLAKPARLEPLERFTLLDDAWAFTLAGRFDAPSYLRIAESYRDETEYYIWQLLLRSLDELTRVADAGVLARLQERIRTLCLPTAERLGWEPGPAESDLTRRLRGRLLVALGTFAGAGATVAKAAELAGRVMDDAKSVDPEVVAAVLAINAANGGAGQYEGYASRYRRAVNPQEERRFLAGLADFPDPTLAARTFEAALDGTIRSQDGAITIARLLANRKVSRQAWGLLTDNWDRLVERIPTTMVRAVLIGVPYLSQPDLAAEAKAFFADHPVPQGTKTLPQKLELLDVRVALRQREAARLG